jgi:hypothetical protein
MTGSSTTSVSLLSYTMVAQGRPQSDWLRAVQLSLFLSLVIKDFGVPSNISRVFLFAQWNRIGSMIQKAGAGPEPIPHKKLDVDNLRDAIKFATSPSAKNAARIMADQIKSEVRQGCTVSDQSPSLMLFLQDGVRRGVDSFYRHLPLLNMRCDLDPSRLAIWWSTEHVGPMFSFDALRRLIEAPVFEIERFRRAGSSRCQAT